MNVKIFSLSRASGLLAAALFIAGGAAPARAAAPAAESDALPTFTENYVKVSALGASMGGSHAAFQKATQISKQGTGGIEEFNYTKDLDKTTSVQVDGRALPGAEDYLAQFKLTRENVGTFEAGYQRTRTFYDGMGGFFPLNNAWLPIYPRALFVDRGRFFVDGTIALPKAPVFTFSYTNETRSGRKDSTIWGDSDLTGVPVFSSSALNPVSSNRKIIPAYIQLGERQERWELGVKHTIEKTTVQLAVIGTRINNLDTRSVDRYPGELKPFPAIPSSPVTLVPNNFANNPNKGFDQQGVKEDGLTWTGRVETVFNDQLKAYVSALYRHATSDVAGSRLITASIMTGTGLQNLVGGFTPAGRPPYSIVGTGNTSEDVFTGTAGVEWKPLKDLELAAALKGENVKTSGNYLANYVSNMVVLATGVVTPVPLSAPNSMSISEKPWIPEASARYSGIRNVSLFALWDYRTAPSDEKTNYVSITTSSGPVVLSAPTLSNDRVKEKHTNLKLGANWTPMANLTLRGEFFTKDHENSFTGYGPALGNYYILDYDTYGARVSAIVRLTPALSFSTRYVVSRGKAEIAEDAYVLGNSNDTRRYEIAETIDWTPGKSIYVQANANVVWDTTGTVYPRAGGAANDVLHNADNNYWNASLVTGFVIDQETDALVQATYYKADNYERALAAATMPYGQGGHEYSVTVGLKHKFSDRMVGSAKIGYYENKNETTGGYANYKGPVGYLSLDYKL
ncbi:MAG TPA: hypothetical protein VHD62_10955 [Opitutaceae bacterium]|nr:hypothetical protein [Opitutaceae bacterium]